MIILFNKENSSIHQNNSIKKFQNLKTAFNDKTIKNDFNSSTHKFIPYDVEGNPIESEDELSDDEYATRLYDGNCTYFISKQTEEDH